MKDTDLPALSSISHRTPLGFCPRALSVVFHKSSRPVWGRTMVVLSWWERWHLRTYLWGEFNVRGQYKMDNIKYNNSITSNLYRKKKYIYNTAVCQVTPPSHSLPRHRRRLLWYYSHSVNPQVPRRHKCKDHGSRYYGDLFLTLPIWPLEMWTQNLLGFCFFKLLRIFFFFQRHTLPLPSAVNYSKQHGNPPDYHGVGVGYFTATSAKNSSEVVCDACVGIIFSSYESA